MFGIGSVDQSVDAARKQNDRRTILGELFQQQTQLPRCGSKLLLFKHLKSMFIGRIQDLIFLSVEFVKTNGLIDIDDLSIADLAAVERLADRSRCGFGNQNASFEILRGSLDSAGQVDGFPKRPVLKLVL